MVLVSISIRVDCACMCVYIVYIPRQMPVLYSVNEQTEPLAVLMRPPAALAALRETCVFAVYPMKVQR
jgi:hypothetical protein